MANQLPALLDALGVVGKRIQQFRERKETVGEENTKATLEHLIAAGLIKPPLEIERDYKNVHFTAVIEASGKVIFGEGAYDSLSTAAGVARRSIIGAPADRLYPQTNGWQFWQYRDEHGELRQLDQIRKKYGKRAAAANA